MKVGKDVEVIISDEADLWIALAEVDHLARAAGFPAADTARLKTAASELAQNILKYAGRGRLCLRLLDPYLQAGACELVAQDQGPGIADISVAMRDSYSTGGTLGLGLPGVRRLSEHFKIESKPGAGTVVTARFSRR
ncbi:serine/threonine-protein kinase RsbT [Paucibacter oligotrophus]|uniref:Serine/threonine-protein kinase RsbT n=1 Tax=Roseateles oligotrophus TaxID=1769250 RepID=A0A840LAS4_9BURK|nr:ATP-binding protein [Roseateles oligotrophus]MBB4845246.1 serine/threonine-protein kinase RsbT [Roseateles oligotrophus]